MFIDQKTNNFHKQKRASYRIDTNISLRHILNFKNVLLNRISMKMPKLLSCGLLLVDNFFVDFP